METTYSADPNETLTGTEFLGIVLIGSAMAVGAVATLWLMVCRVRHLTQPKTKGR